MIHKVESNGPLVLATILDPCLKDKFYSGFTEKANAKTLFKKLAEVADSPSFQEPSPKHSKISVMNTFLEICKEVGVTVSDTSGSDVDRYQSEPLLGAKQRSFSITIKISSAIFISSLHICEIVFNKHLAPEKAEMLLFIKTNFKLLDGKFICITSYMECTCIHKISCS